MLPALLCHGWHNYFYMGSGTTLNNEVRLAIEGELASWLINTDSVLISIGEARVASALSRITGIKDGDTLLKLVNELMVQMPLYLVHMGHAGGYYILVPPIIFERHFMRLGGRARLGRMVRVAGKLLELWQEVEFGADSGMGRIISFEEVEQKIALLLYRLFENNELYESNPKEWYHALLAKSYPHIVMEEYKSGNVFRRRVGNIWIVEKVEDGGVLVYSREI